MVAQNEIEVRRRILAARESHSSSGNLDEKIIRVIAKSLMVPIDRVYQLDREYRDEESLTRR